MVKAIKQAAKSTITVTIPTTVTTSAVLSYFYNVTLGTALGDMVPYFILAVLLNVGMFFTETVVLWRRSTGHDSLSQPPELPHRHVR